MLLLLPSFCKTNQQHHSGRLTLSPQKVHFINILRDFCTMSIRGLFPIDRWDFQRSAVLRDLPPEDLQALDAAKITHRYKKGEILFRQGGFPAGIFHITEGKVKKYTIDNHDREQIIYIANAGEMIGYHAILAEDYYPDSAAALEDSCIDFIPSQDFLRILNESSVLSKRLLKTLSHEFAVLANHLSVQAQRTVRERLALHLVVLREKYKVGFSPGMAVEIDMGREDLAKLIGTVRENVVRILTDFKSEGILETKGRKIIIHDVHQLIKIAGYA